MANKNRIHFYCKDQSYSHEDPASDNENNNRNNGYSVVKLGHNSDEISKCDTGNNLKQGLTSDWNSCIDAGSAALERRQRNKRLNNQTGSLNRRKQRKNVNVFQQMQMNSLAKERKLSRMLIVLVFVFAFCWFPFFFVYVSEPFCRGDDATMNKPQICSFLQHRVVFHVVTWLGYINSMFNPIIYTMFIKDFRVAFQNMLCCYKL